MLPVFHLFVRYQYSQVFCTRAFDYSTGLFNLKISRLALSAKRSHNIFKSIPDLLSQGIEFQGYHPKRTVAQLRYQPINSLYIYYERKINNKTDICIYIPFNSTLKIFLNHSFTLSRLPGTSQKNSIDDE